MRIWLLKVPSSESYLKRHAPQCPRLLTSRRSAPFLLALGFNVAIPANSRVAEYPDLFPVLYCFLPFLLRVSATSRRMPRTVYPQFAFTRKNMMPLLCARPVSRVTLLPHVVTNSTRKGALLHARACLHPEEVRHSCSL